jgi:hypothetical protein
LTHQSIQFDLLGRLTKSFGHAIGWCSPKLNHNEEAKQEEIEIENREGIYCGLRAKTNTAESAK